MEASSTKPYRDPQGKYVSLAQQKLRHARERLLTLRSLGPTVYADQGAFAKLGVQMHEAKMRLAEIDAGLWEGRAGL